MACTYTINDETFGKIEVLERSNSRGLSIRIHEGGIIRVTVRTGTSEAEIGRYIKEQSLWIAEALKRMERRSAELTVFTRESDFSIAGYKLVMTADSKDNKVYLKVKPGVIMLNYPASVDPATSEVVQKLVRKGIAFVLKKEAEKVIPQRLKHLAETHGFKYESLELKDLKSRWGSCSTKREIVINVQIMRLPVHLIDHVLLHELCHTVEMNHGTKFHALLNKVDGGKAMIHDKELTKYRTQRW